MSGDHVFVTTATEDVASCRVIGIDRINGEVLWNREVHHQVADDRIYVTSEAGFTTLLQPVAQYKEITANKLVHPGLSWVSRGRWIFGGIAVVSE